MASASGSGRTAIAKSLDWEFLAFASELFPERVYALVKAYACSVRLTAQAESLRFSAHSEPGLMWNPLIEAWLGDGDVDSCLGRVSKVIENYPEIAVMGDRLAISLLRHFRFGGRERVRAMIERLNLSRDGKLLYDLLYGQITEGEYFRNSTARSFMLASFAGVEFSPSVETVCRFKIEDHEFWWMLASLPVTRRSIGQLLNLPAELRAIFGLCTATEWNDIERHDQALVNEIIECRRNRPVEFGRSTET